MKRGIFYKIFIFLLAVGGIPLLVSLPLEYKNIQDLSREVSSLTGINEKMAREVNFIIEDTEILVWLIFFFTLILVIFVSVLLTRKINRPLKRMITASNEIKKGNLEARVDIETGDEFEELGNTFNKMAGELKKTNASLKQALAQSRQAQKRAEAEKEKTKSTLNSLVDGLLVLDEDKRIDLVNPKAQKILGVDKDEAAGETIEQNLHYPKLKKLYDILEGEVRTTGKEVEVFLEDPFPSYFQVNVIPVISEKEKIGTMIVLHNITREKRVERLKNEFVSIAAHQLRTPLSAMKWGMETISEELKQKLGKKYSRELKQIFQKTQSRNEAMIELVDDLLNISRIEEGRFVGEKEVVPLKNLIREINQDLEDEASKNNIEVKLTKFPDQKIYIKADKAKIKLVFRNLLENAITYSYPNSKVFIRIREARQKEGQIQVEIKDNGIGISQNDQEKVFSKFSRGKNAVKSETKGSGLGLFIVKNIVEAHGGEIWFKSKLNQGSSFFFTLPTTSSDE